jgi:predicted DNA-binding transcriptional regulator YafY
MSCKVNNDKPSHKKTVVSASKKISQSDTEKENIIKTAISSKTDIQIHYK